MKEIWRQIVLHPGFRKCAGLLLMGGGAMGSAAAVHFVTGRYGISGGIGAVGLLISIGAMLHLFSEFQLDRLYRDWRRLGPGRQADAFGRMSPRIRQAMKRRLKAEGIEHRD